MPTLCSPISIINVKTLCEMLAVCVCTQKKTNVELMEQQQQQKKKKNRSNIKTNSIKTLKRQKESGLYDKVGWGGDHGVRYRTMTSKYRTNKVGISLDTSLVTSKTLEQKQVLRFPEF